ncbi:MAG: hypothetical protein QOI41_7587 [Myxococcales bacterium]|nr:hypothetical protein [Myxococcales bacterium]
MGAVHALQHASSMELSPNDTYWRRLMHRWLVEYNPLYLLSATLVLGGMILTSRGLAREGSLYGEIGVAAIAELYAATLIGGAALLTRIGHRRPAVMLALLTVLYQCDLTLQTEASPYLGGVGTAATTAWLALFMAKLGALAWAMKLRVSRAAYATAAFAALGLAILPRYLHDLEPRSASALVALWLFGTFTLHGAASTGTSASEGNSDSTSGVTSAVPLDAWGATVLRRAVRASWSLGALLFVGHVMFWSTQHPITLAALLPVAPLLAVRGVRGEAQTWILVVATLLFVALAMPSAFAVTALMAAAALVVRALLPGVRSPASAASPAVLPRDEAGPYRAFDAFDAGDPPRPAPAAAAPVFVPPSFVLVERAERMRLLTGALFTLHLAVWTLGWTGGDWPAHVLALDLATAAVALLFAWRARVRVALVPLAAGAMDLVVRAHLVPAPRSLLEWGATAVGLGFALLLASLAASYRLRRTS